MELDRKKFLAALRVVKKAINSRATMPALRDVRIEASGQSCSVLGTDIQTVATATISSNGDAFPGLHVPVVPLVEAVANLKTDMIKLTLVSDGLLIEDNDSSYNLELGVPEEEQPKIPADDDDSYRSFSCDGLWLYRALRFLTPAISKDQTRFHLNVLAVDKGNLVSTDGHRLHLCRMRNALSQDIVDRALSTTFCNVAYAALGADKSFLVDLTFYNGGRSLAVIQGERLKVYIVDRRINCSPFPPYDHVIPKMDDSCELVCPAKELLSAARGAKTSIKKPSVTPLQLTVWGDGLQVGTNNFSTRIKLGGIATTSKRRFGMNVDYLISSLVNFEKGENVRFSFDGELDPFLVRHEGHEDELAVLMPMRLE